MRLSQILIPLVIIGVFSTQPTKAQPTSSESPSDDLATLTVSDTSATSILVLGTTHLSGMEDQFEPIMVDSLLMVLKQFRPQVIGVEKMSGRQVAAMVQWGGIFDEVVSRFAGPFQRHGHRAQSATGLSWTAANREADSLLTVARDENLNSQTRLRLVHTLTAAYRFPTAALQWSYVPDEVRDTQDQISPELASALTDYLKEANEVSSIGLRLARALGRSRVYPIDSHTSKDQLAAIWPSIRRVFSDMARAAIDNAAYHQKEEALLKQGIASGSLLSYYRYLNSDAFLQGVVDVQWGTYRRANRPSGLGQRRLALWEARNLNIAGNIRRASSRHPGERVLVIVGSSHKPYLDDYLSRMTDVEIVKFSDLLPAAQETNQASSR